MKQKKTKGDLFKESGRERERGRDILEDDRRAHRLVRCAHTHTHTHSESSLSAFAIFGFFKRSHLPPCFKCTKRRECDLKKKKKGKNEQFFFSLSLTLKYTHIHTLSFSNSVRRSGMILIGSLSFKMLY